MATIREKSFGQEKNNFFDNLIFRLRTGKITKQFKKKRLSGEILDIGCGYRAVFLKKILADFPEIIRATGIDLQTEKTISENIRLIETDINESIPLTNQYDTIFCSAVIEHLNNPNILVREIYRLLKKDSWVFLTTPSPMAKPILEFLAFKLKLINKDEILDHKKYFSKKELKLIFQKNGFSNIKVKSFELGLNHLLIAQKQ